MCFKLLLKAGWHANAVRLPEGVQRFFSKTFKKKTKGCKQLIFFFQPAQQLKAGQNTQQCHAFLYNGICLEYTIAKQIPPPPPQRCVFLCQSWSKIIPFSQSNLSQINNPTFFISLQNQTICSRKQFTDKVLRLHKRKMTKH